MQGVLLALRACLRQAFHADISWWIWCTFYIWFLSDCFFPACIQLLKVVTLVSIKMIDLPWWHFMKPFLDVYYTFKKHFAKPFESRKQSKEVADPTLRLTLCSALLEERPDFHLMSVFDDFHMPRILNNLIWSYSKSVCLDCDWSRNCFVSGVIWYALLVCGRWVCDTSTYKLNWCIFVSCCCKLHGLG